MLRATLILEDTILTADADENGWQVTASDTMTGQSFKFTANNVQFGAILALAAGLGEDIYADEYDLVSRLYTLVGNVLDTCPKECYPIP